MANVFDQFDEVEAGNPFDEFDPDPQVEAKKAKNRKTLSAGERFLAGVRSPIDGGTQMAAKANKWLADRGLVPRLEKDPLPEIEQRRAAYEAGKPEGFDWANLAGQIVSPANLALMVIPGGGVVKAASLGAASGALEPVAEGEDFTSAKARQMARGAAGGAAFNVGARAVGRVLSPNAAQNQQLRLLRREGVQPTIGQALGGRASKTEEKLMSVPIFGDAIGLARDRSRRQFNQAALNRVTDTLPPGTPRVREVGTEGVREAGDRVSRVYDEADALLNTPRAPRVDRRTLTDVQDVIRRAQQGGLPQMHQDTLRALLNEVGTDVSRFGTIRDFKRIDSRLGERAAHFGKSGSAYERDLGTSIGDIQRALREGMMRRRPQAGVLNTMADDAYGNLVRVENAANRAALTGGNFTPGQLLQSIKQGDPRIRHRGFARGEARMQDFAQAGQEVLGSTVPNSGSADRLLLPSLARGATTGTGLGAASAVDPTGASQAVLATLGAGAAAYTPLVQRLLVAAASNRPEVAAAARAQLARIAPHLAVPGAAAANGFFSEE